MIQHTKTLVCIRIDNIRPLLICEHGLNAPPRAKYIEGLGEAVVVNEPRVDREKPHHQDDVTSVEKHQPYLKRDRDTAGC